VHQRVFPKWFRALIAMVMLVGVATVGYAILTLIRYSLTIV
jgi:hypothetical protein